MLTIASLGMLVYGIYSAGWAVADLLRGAQLEVWAELGLMAFGALLALAAAFVRVRLPGGLAFAIGQLYVLARLWVKLVFWASATSLFQARLAHAGYVAAAAPVWPESPSAEALR